MLLLFTTGAMCQRNNAVRVDLAQAACFGTIDITLAHRIGEKWSIEGQTAINIKRLSNGKDDETIHHWNALSGTVDRNGEKTFRDNLTETSISVRFWPLEVFHGPAFSLGVLTRDRTGPDISCGIGYCFPVWKGICTDLGFSICILETKRNRTIQYNGIRLGFSYAF